MRGTNTLATPFFFLVLAAKPPEPERKSSLGRRSLPKPHGAEDFALTLSVLNNAFPHQQDKKPL
jgi:hypothetical protein